MLSSANLLRCGIAILSLTCCQAEAVDTIQAVQNLRLLPISFESTAGDQGKDSEYAGHGMGYELVVRPSNALLHLQTRTGSEETVRMSFVGADPRGYLEPIGLQSGVSNYLMGADPKKDRIGVSRYSKVVSHSVYPGIDLLYYGRGSEFEYDLLLAPGADPSQIRIRVEGVRDISFTADGDLVLKTATAQLIQRKPLAYQEIAGRRSLVRGKYIRRGKNEIGFEVSAHDPHQRLVIDPVLSFSSYLSGDGGGFGYAVVADSQGYVYAIGNDLSSNFPCTHALPSVNPSFMVKFDPRSQQVVYATCFLGSARAAAVDSSGQVVIAGFTLGSSIQLVNPLQGTFHIGQNQGFVAKLNATGDAFVFATYLSSSGTLANAVALDSQGNVYVAGTTSDATFPVKNAYQPSLAGSVFNSDAFVLKMDSTGSTLIFSTYLGGSDTDTINALAVDLSGNVWVTGGTASRDFPMVNALQGPPAMATSTLSAFVAKLDSAGSQLLYSTYLGTGGIGPNPSAGKAISTDRSGNAYIAGDAGLSGSFPLVGQFNDSGRCFVGKFTPSGAATFFSQFGTEGACTGLTLRPNGTIAVSGTTQLMYLPLVDAVQTTYGTNQIGFVMVLEGDGSAIDFSSYLGGISIYQTDLNGIVSDSSGNLYVVGEITGPNSGYPLTNPLPGTASATSGALLSEIQPASACSFQLNTNAVTIPIKATPQYGSVSVTAPAGCLWNASGPYVEGALICPDCGNSNVYQGVGSGTVPIEVDPTDALSKTAHIQVAGHKVTVNVQGAACSYSLSVNQANVAAAGGSGEFTVNNVYPCSFSTSVSAGWITITYSNPSPSAVQIGYAVSANPGAARQGTITVAGLSFTVSQASTIAPSLNITKHHTGNFTQGQNSANYTVAVSNVSGAGATNGTVTVTETVPSGLTLVSMAGTGWACPGSAANNCSRSDVLNGGATYPPLTVIVNVASNAPTSVTNQVSVTGGGSSGSSASDVTTVNPPPVALRFIPITPCRVADTRNPTGPFGGPAIAGNSSRDFNIPSSACGIPSTAQAYSLNVAVVPQGELGYLTVWPTGQAQPLVSTLNSLDGRIKSNAAIVWAGTNGSISAYADYSATDLILDINGYFVPATNTSALAFYPIAPCRIADTRNATGSLGGPTFSAVTSRTFPILSSSCNLPSTAQAYSINFAAVPNGPLGYLTAWPTGQPRPLVATLNAPTGTVTGNAAIVPAGTNGSIDVYATAPTDVVIDINGYFAPMGAGGLSLYGVAPCRVMDTRNLIGSQPITSITVAVSSSACGIPVSAQAHVFSATVLPQGVLGFLTLWPEGETQPLVSTLNAQDGAITSNMAIVPTTNGSISAFASAPTQLILDTAGYFGQ